jgi:pimeloyl-ACP methyl ester carboxylesterase
MPRLGMTMEEGTVIEWPLAIGDPIQKGETVLVIESEKTEVDVEAAASGVLRHIYIEEGETVPCGTPLGAITETMDEPFDAEAFHAEITPAAIEPEPNVAIEPTAVAAASSPSSPKGKRKPIVPAARAIAKKLGIDPELVPGTGPGGRVTKQDVEAFAAKREALTPVADGVCLEVLVAGEGAPVVLLPGFGTDVSAFAMQTGMLSERFSVVGINPRGVGLSDAPAAEAYSVAQTAADVAACYEGKAHVIGASLGAAAAIELALTQPDRVCSLTLITPFVAAGGRLRAVADGWCRVAREASPDALATMLLPWLFASGTLEDAAAQQRILRGLTQTVKRVPAPTLDRMAAGLMSWSGSREGDIASISLPTLVIAAADDLLTPGADRLAPIIPGAKLVVVPNAGHAVAIEAPDAVNGAIAAHLG